MVFRHKLNKESLEPSNEFRALSAHKYILVKKANMNNVEVLTI